MTAGQILATLDSTQASAAAQGAESSLKVSQMNLANAETSSATLQRNLNEAKSTLSTDESGGTTVQKDQSQSALDSAEQTLTNDQNQLTTEQTTLSTDESNLATAQSTYNSDEALGCPAAPSSAGSSGSGSGTVTANAGGASVGWHRWRIVAHNLRSRVNATINPNGAATTYYFVYGTTDGVRRLDRDLHRSLRAQIRRRSQRRSRGLSPSTTYIFNVVATNANGSSEGVGETLDDSRIVLHGRQPNDYH